VPTRAPPPAPPPATPIRNYSFILRQGEELALLLYRYLERVRHALPGSRLSFAVGAPAY